MTGIDLDALLAPTQWAANSCHVGQALARIPDEGQRAKVAAAALNPKVPVEGMRSAFTHLVGITPKENPIRRHRKGGCGCE